MVNHYRTERIEIKSVYIVKRFIFFLSPVSKEKKMKRLILSRNPLAWLGLPSNLKHRVAAYIDWKAFVMQFFPLPTAAMSRQGPIRSSFCMESTSIVYETKPLPIDPTTNQFTFLFDKHGFFAFLESLSDVMDIIHHNSLGLPIDQVCKKLREKGFSEEESCRFLFGDLPFPDLEKKSEVEEDNGPSLDLPLVEWRKWPTKLRDLLQSTFLLDPTVG